MEHDSSQLSHVVALLAAMVVMVPLFRRIGLGSILGYLAGGLVIGPYGFGWFSHPETILHVAELGVIMFLFVVGLEMRPSHLWSLRREIFGLGTVQVAVATLLLTSLGLVCGFRWQVAFFGSMGFVLTSTAVVMQTLDESGDRALPRGQRMVSILLFEDLLIVPLLALIAFLSPEAAQAENSSRWMTVLLGVASLAGLVAVGVWLLNPFFRLLAAAKAREVMTAAALLVVLGSALLMQLGGLSMALGAFLAGVLLSGSTFRHQIETDIDPFRGVLLGLFFLAVGMSLDVRVFFEHWPLIVSAVFGMMLVKGLAIYGVARVLRSSHQESLERAVVMAQGGEFAFVLFAAALRNELLDPTVAAELTAVVVLSMALTPLFVRVYQRWLQTKTVSMEGVDVADGLSGSVLLIGFGRFGQVISQALLARDVDVTIIDNDADMIRSAAEFGFKVYYGDGTRLDVLHHSGAGTARVVAVCVDNKTSALKIVELLSHEFPRAKVLVRSFDRQHARELVAAGVTYQIRETFESALRFGEAALLELGESQEDAAEIVADVRRRDAERFELEIAGGRDAGKALLRGNLWKPTPLIAPRREGKTLGAEQGEGEEATL